MNIKRIIKEEVNKDLLIEGKIGDLFSKFDMTEIKRLLKEKMGIDETSTKMDIAKKLVKYWWKLELKLLKYELGAVLGGFVFYFLSIILDAAGVEPFVTQGPNNEPGIPHFILWGAGALLNVIRMVRSDLREEEVDDFDWIREIKPSWLRVGQRFTNRNNLQTSRRYEPKDKVQVGSNTFEIFDINEKDGKQYLRFVHNDTLGRYNKSMEKFGTPGGHWDIEHEKQQSYRGITFEQAEKNIDSGFWIPLIDCKFIPSEHPNLIGKVDGWGKPYGHTYCTPDTDYENLYESIKLPINVGDTVYMGKFKNKKTVVKDIEWNDKGDLMINGKSALRVRVPKKAKKSIKEQDDFDWIRNEPAGFPTDSDFFNLPIKSEVVTLYDVFEREFNGSFIGIFLNDGRLMEVVVDTEPILKTYNNFTEFGEDLSLDIYSEEDYLNEWPTIHKMSEMNGKLDVFLKEKFPYIKEIWVGDL